MDQLQPFTSTTPNSQTVSSMSSSVSSLTPNELMRSIEQVVPYGTEPQNVSLNGSSIYMMPKATNLGFQQIGMPKTDLNNMGVLFNDIRTQHMQLPMKRKSPMQNLSGYPLSPVEAMSGNKIGQTDNRPWFNTLASNKVQYQMQLAAGVQMPQQLTVQNRRTTQFQAGPPRSGSLKPSTPRNHPIQGQPSPMAQNQSNESVRSKLRESISAALALVIEKEKQSSQVDISVSANANASDKMQEGSQSAEVAPSVSQAELSGDIQTQANQDCSTQTENNLKSELSVVDCDVGGSLQILDGVGQELDMIDILPDVGDIAGNFCGKDDLLQGNGLAWVMDFDAWIAEKEGHGPMKQKVGEHAGGAQEVKITSSPQNLALQIELELFKLFGGVNKKYKEKGRSLLFNLKDKNNPELREKVMSGKISPACLCSMSADELASKELAEWRIAKAEEFEQMKILPDSDIDIRRLVKKTHKGEFQVEVEEDDVSVEVSVGSSSFPQIQTKAKKIVPQSGQISNGAEEKTNNEKANSEEQNLPCAITVSSNDSDLMQGLIEEDIKDAESLPPIVSLDEFMESLRSEPPFECLPPNADKKSGSPDNDDAEVPSESKVTKLSPKYQTRAASVAQNSLSSEDLKVETGIKPTDNQSHIDISPPAVLSKSEHIWEGLLHLSISSSISVSGYFKSGEKAATKDWPPTMEIKGRVRLDAFEKFLQDLYKSQSRSIMVMHVIMKDSKERDAEALSQVVDSYVADARVGFSEPIHGLEVYLCPNHPKILDRIEKHLVKDQKEAITLTGDDKGLIGVVVSRKAVSPNSSSHHKHGFKKPQQEHYTSSRRQNRHQGRNINVNASNLKLKYPVVPLVSSKTTYPEKVATDEDDVPPGFGPRSSQDEDDLPEFNFSSGLSQSVPTQFPTQNRPIDQMRQLVHKYGKTAASVGNWKDDEDDIPEWQPQVPLSPAPQATPPHLNYQPLNQPMLQQLINRQQQLLRSPLQQPQVLAPLQPPMPDVQHTGWAQSGVWLNPQHPQQGQFYGAQSRGF